MGYVDVEAVRVRGLELPSLSELLAEAYARYNLPIAITEAHLGCTREEQCRWFVDVWNEAERARSCGADVRAVTAWALLGSYDWNSLVTEPRGHYEAGAFDVRAGEPRPTALVEVLRDVAAGKRPEHPTLEEPGWWKRSERWFYEAEFSTAFPGEIATARGHRRSLVVFGPRGALTQTLSQLATSRGLVVVNIDPLWLESGDRDTLRAALKRFHPWGVVLIDEWSAAGAALLASVCADMALALLTFSSAHVFDGRRLETYVESCQPSPTTDLGRRHAKIEECVLELHPAALVVRTGPLWVPGDPDDFVASTVRALRRGETLPLPAQGRVTPALVGDVVHASLDLLVDGASGIWHLAGPDAVSWEELVGHIARRLGLGPDVSTRRDAMASSLCPGALASERHAPLRSLEDALQQTVNASDLFNAKEPRYA